MSNSTDTNMHTVRTLYGTDCTIVHYMVLLVSVQMCADCAHGVNAQPPLPLPLPTSHVHKMCP